MPIELVQDGPFLLLQFNQTCEESLRVCNALCCRLRPGFSVPLTKEESNRMKWHYVDPENPLDEPMMVLDDDGRGNCIYLEGNKCSIHDKKPEACRTWHCSPQGEGEGLTRKDKGWALWPAHAVEG